MISKKCFISFITILFIACTVNANQITVVKQATANNPKLIFKGITGNTTFSKYILSDLKKCGWFDVVSSGTSKYTVSGKASGTQIEIYVRGASSFNVSVKINSKNPKWTSYQLVDHVLKKLFGINGICAAKIAFVTQSSTGKTKEIFTCNFDGSEIKQISNNGSLSLEPSWSMNNKLLVYTFYRGNYVDVVGYNFNKKKLYNLANFPGLNNAGVISPNGKFLAVILSKDKKIELYIKQINSTRLRRVTNNDAVEGTPCWAPDSLNICYASNLKYGRPGLYVYNIATKKTTRIKTVGSEALSPSWSPSGKKIVYSAKFGRHYTLAVYDVKTGTSSTFGLNAAGDWFSPSWAPDNRHIICSRKLNYKSQLYVVDTWTGKARKLLSSGLNLTSPDWSSLY
jgi:TolB protein